MFLWSSKKIGQISSVTTCHGELAFQNARKVKIRFGCELRSRHPD